MRLASQLIMNEKQQMEYMKKIDHNNHQNAIIEEKLNDFIDTLMQSDNNDQKVTTVLSEFETSMALVKKLTI